MSIQQSFSFTYILMARTTTDLNQVPGKLYYTCAMSVCNLTCLMKEQISLKSNKVSSKSTEQFRRNCTFFCMDRWTGWIKMIAHFSLYEITTFNNISAISWRPVLMVEEYGVPTRREPPTMGKQLVNFITCGCESSAPFFVIYKARCQPTPYWW